MELLRFITTGSVDDGKSTLIGRLLYDSRVLLSDQVEEIKRLSQRQGEEFNLALITDGLRSEREQGITIDVAYRFFSTLKRKFVIIDAPGHVQYTRNMVTGASNADVGLILIDATKGVQEQTKRHSFLLSLLGVSQVIVCVNKMDLVGHSDKTFKSIQSEYGKFGKTLRFQNTIFLPVSSLHGDNIVQRSAKMPWYSGPTLLELLEEMPVQKRRAQHFRFPIQGLIRVGGGSTQDFRAYTGMVMGGSVEAGDEIVVLPSEARAKIKALYRHPEKLIRAQTGDSVSIEIDRDIDIGRGDMFVAASGPKPVAAQELSADVCWFSLKELTPGGRLVFRHTANEARCTVDEIAHRVDIHTFAEQPAPAALEMNDIGRIKLRLNKPIFYDAYAESKLTGCGILIDEVTNSTVAAVMF